MQSKLRKIFILRFPAKSFFLTTSQFAPHRDYEPNIEQINQNNKQG